MNPASNAGHPGSSRLSRRRSCSDVFIRTNISMLDGDDSSGLDAISIFSTMSIIDHDIARSTQESTSSEHFNLIGNSVEVHGLSFSDVAAIERNCYVALLSILKKYSVEPKTSGALSTRLSTAVDRSVFGADLGQFIKRSGTPLPEVIMGCMSHLAASGTVGIFRKSGLKSRTTDLRLALDEPDCIINMNSCNPYDLADIIKIFFRKLPQPLFTTRVSKYLQSIQKSLMSAHMPEEVWLRSVQMCMMLMPDENRLALKVLLEFLKGISENPEYQMTTDNLAICLGPSLFQTSLPKPLLSESSVMSALPRNIHFLRSNRNCQKEVTNSCHIIRLCLGKLITFVTEIFKVPNDIYQRTIIQEKDFLESATATCRHRQQDHDMKTCLSDSLLDLVKEQEGNFRNFETSESAENITLSFKRNKQSCPVNVWRGEVEVSAPHTEVLACLMSNRRIWNDTAVKEQVVRDGGDWDLFYHCYKLPVLGRLKDHVIARVWENNAEQKYSALACSSVNDPDAPSPIGDLTHVYRMDFFALQQTNGKTLLNYILQVDVRGVRVEFLNNWLLPHMVISELDKIRKKFEGNPDRSSFGAPPASS